MAVSARFIANKASYKFHGNVIGDMTSKLKGVIGIDTNLQRA
jgi:hypothetical protein